MEEWLGIVMIAAIVISLIGSVVIVSYVLRRQRKREAESGITQSKVNASRDSKTQGRKWNWIISIYLLLCFTCIVIILYQNGQGTINRQAFDCLAVPVGALFFLIQAVTTRNIAIRRECTTVHATATFEKLETLSSNSEFQKSYYSILEFSVNERTYQVRYGGKINKEKGAQVEIYYAPHEPNIIYVPEIEAKKSKFFSAVLFIYGILFPLVALLAPLFR